MTCPNLPRTNLAESSAVGIGGTRSNEKKIAIHAVSDNTPLHFMVLPETKLQAVMDDFCLSTGVIPSTVHFEFNGNKVLGHDTCASLTIQQNDKITVVTDNVTCPKTPEKKTTPNSKNSSKRKIPMKHFMQSPLSIPASSENCSSSAFASNMFCNVKKNLFATPAVASDVFDKTSNKTIRTRDLNTLSARSAQMPPPLQSTADILLTLELDVLASNNTCTQRSLTEH
jgi:hypothetical protein